MNCMAVCLLGDFNDLVGSQIGKLGRGWSNIYCFIRLKFNLHENVISIKYRDIIKLNINFCCILPFRRGETLRLHQKKQRLFSDLASWLS